MLGKKTPITRISEYQEGKMCLKGDHRNFERPTWPSGWKRIGSSSIRQTDRLSAFLWVSLKNLLSFFPIPSWFLLSLSSPLPFPIRFPFGSLYEDSQPNHMLKRARYTKRKGLLLFPPPPCWTTPSPPPPSSPCFMECLFRIQKWC